MARRFPFNPATMRDGFAPRWTSQYTRYRWLFLAAEIVVILGIIQYVWLRPRYSWDQSVSELPRTMGRLSSGTILPGSGPDTLNLPGLQPAARVFLAPLKGLAEGSQLAQATQLQTMRELKVPLEVVNRIGMRFRLIPAGTYVMGSPKNEARRWIGEVQQVATIGAPFYMGMCEVTQGQWLAVMKGNPSFYKRADLPVEEVTWEEAVKFADRLCEKEGVPRGTYRLPMEKEWEYACRGGTTAAYCFGNDPRRLEFYADYFATRGRGTGPVGQYLPNAYGLFDMHGNVWEWCLDYFVNYLRAPDQEKGEEEYWRCIRGGNWQDPPENCRSANRVRLPPASKGNILGFRLMRSLPEIRKPAAGTAAAGGTAALQAERVAALSTVMAAEESPRIQDAPAVPGSTPAAAP